MTTAVISNASRNEANNTYFTNLGRAAYSLVTALLALPSSKPTEASTPTVTARVRRYEEELSLYRLYRLSGPFDSVSPALLDELRIISGRS